MSGSCARSQHIRRLRVDGHEEVLPRTGEQLVDGSLVPRRRTPDEAIVPALETLDVELLPRFDTVDLGNSAGRKIWPLEETVVFMQVRYRLTCGSVRRLTRQFTSSRPASVHGQHLPPP